MGDISLHRQSTSLTHCHSEAVTSQVELVETVFTGGIELDRNGTFYRSEDRTQVQYVGAPSPAIDKAWTNLLTGQLNLVVTFFETSN